MPGTKGKSGGRRNEIAAQNGKEVGRPPKSVKIEAERPIKVVFVGRDGTYSQLAEGVTEIRKTALSRVIVVPTTDGEIRIII